MQTQRHRIISGLTIVLMAAVVAAGWLLVAAPQVANAQSGAAQLAAAESQVQTAQAKVDALRSDKGKLPELQAQLAALKASIPDDLDAAPFIRELATLAAQHGVTVTDVSVSPAVYYAPPAAAASAAAPSSTAAVAGPSNTPSPAPSASAAAAATATAAQQSDWAAPTDAAINATNFVTIPVDVKFTGSWDQVIGFLTALQTGPRLYLVDTLTSDVGGGSGTATVDSAGLLYATTDVSAPRSMSGHEADKVKPGSTRSSVPTPAATRIPAATPNPTGTASPSPTKTPSGGDGSTPGD